MSPPTVSHQELKKLTALHGKTDQASAPGLQLAQLTIDEAAVTEFVCHLHIITGSAGNLQEFCSNCFSVWSVRLQFALVLQGVDDQKTMPFRL